MDDDTPWIPPCLHGASVDEDKTFVTGYVEFKEHLEKVIEANKRAYLSTFVSWSDDIKKMEKSGRRLPWKYQDIHSNTPFMVERSVVLLCQYGLPKDPGEAIAVNESDHNFKRRRFNLQTTKNLGCTAQLSIKYVKMYPQYSAEESAGRLRKQTQLHILTDQLKTQNVASDSRIYVKFH